MLIKEIKSIKSNSHEWRKFGLTIGLFLGLLAGILYWRQKPYYFYFFIFAFGFIFSALFMPRILKYVYKVWMIFSILLGWLMTRIILIVLFFLVITPIGFIVRSLGNAGRNSLDLKIDKKADTYWIPKEQTEFNQVDFEKQY